MRTKLWLLPCVVMSGCHETQSATPTPAQTSAPTIAAKHVDGYGPFRLGMSYDDALAVATGAVWNPIAVQQCKDELPVKGCGLSQFGGGIQYRIDGMPFEPQLSFNKHGVLTDLALKYHQPNVTLDQCISLFGRVLAKVRDDYGPIASETPGNDDRAGWTARIAPDGYAYRTQRLTSMDISSRMRTTLSGVKLPNSSQMENWNNEPFVAPFMIYSRAGGPDCTTTLYFELPGTVERKAD